MALMTKQALQSICKEHKLYRTPSLNDKLYCNFKGFVNIANLEEYTGLRALFLEGNAIDSLEGLPALPELRCVYLQQNTITRISNLEGFPNLDTLNISNNLLRTLDNLSCCPMLKTLIATNNKLDSVESISHLASCPGLLTLDLQNNNISDPAVVEVLKQLQELRCLYLKGNPVVSNMKNYRKSLIVALPSLTYLDDRPVFENERRVTEAWARGGLEAEREERKRIKEEEEARDRQNFEFMQQIRKEGWKKRRQRLGLPDGDTDPALDEFSDTEEYDFSEDPPELKAARDRLAAYTYRQGEEEPPELAEARRQRARDGRPVQQGDWDQNTVHEDADIYYASVRQDQASANITTHIQEDLARDTTDTMDVVQPHARSKQPMEAAAGKHEDDTVADADTCQLPDLEALDLAELD